MNSELGFLRLYNQHLVPSLRSLEPLRKAVLSAFIRFSCLMVAAISAFAFYLRYGKLIGLICAMGFLAVGVYAFIRFNRKKKEYWSTFKNQIIKELIALINSNLNYFPELRISQREYIESDLFREPIDRYEGDDLVEGILGQTKCRFSELEHLEKKENVNSRGRRRTYWVTIFKGIFFIADFNKHFHGRTYVVPDAGINLLGIGKLFENWSPNRGERVELENSEFEKLFTVYSTDQVEARYILSTTLMERLVNFRRKAKTKVHVSFIHSNIYLAISQNKNLFEPNLFSSGVKFSYLKYYFNYLELVTGIVDELNLNLRIWGKK